jgi:hypothetical protein
MSNLASTGAVLALGLLVSNAAYAAGVPEYLCMPAPGISKTAYPIECKTVDGVLQEDSCTCDPDFVLVEPNMAEAPTVPKEPVSFE